MKEDYQKALKEVTFFSFEPSPFQSTKSLKNKRSLKLGTSRSSGYKTSSCINQINNSFISYVLSDQVWWCNIKQFQSYSKNYIYKFMQANSWHCKLFHFRLSFWIWKVWKGREKNTKIWISWERKELYRWNKNIFHSFWRVIIWWKNKKLTKNSAHRL